MLTIARAETTNPVADLMNELIAEHTCGSSQLCDAQITAWWNMEVHFQPEPRERHFHYRILSCIVNGQGICYVDPAEPVSESQFLGTCAYNALFKANTQERVAILDALLQDRPATHAQCHSLHGTPKRKAHWRAALVADAVSRSLATTKKRVHMIGVVGLIADELIARGFSVTGTDMDPHLTANGSSFPIEVYSAEHNSILIRDCDLVLATGMTLGNGTFQDILAECTAQGKQIALYAETGSAIAETLAARGVIDMSIAEPFPFYIAQGTSVVRVTHADVRHHA